MWTEIGKDKLYGKCPRISNAFLFLMSNKMLVFKAEPIKMLIRVSNNEGPLVYTQRIEVDEDSGQTPPLDSCTCMLKERLYKERQ